MQLPENAAAQTTKGAAGDTTLSTRYLALRACITIHAASTMVEATIQLPRGQRFTQVVAASSREPARPTRRTPPQHEEWSRRTRAGRNEVGVRTRW